MNTSTKLCSRLFLHRLRQLTGPASSLFSVQPLPLPLPTPTTTAPPRFFTTGRNKEIEEIFQELSFEIDNEFEKKREERKRLGLDTADLDAEEPLSPLIHKLMNNAAKVEEHGPYMNGEQTDSDSEDDERFSADAMKKKVQIFEKKFDKFEGLIKKFVDAETLDDSFKLMRKIDGFEQKHFGLRPEYRVIGELMNRLKVAEGKEKFLLQQKLNRAIRMVEWKELNDPNDPANYGIIEKQQGGASAGLLEEAEAEKEKEMLQREKEDDYLEFDDMKEKDDLLLEKLSKIDKILEEKLAALDHTFGKKGKHLEEEIRDLAEERNSLTEQKRTPLYRKGFDVKLINVNRTQKVTKGGQVVKFTAMLACGNYNGVVGFAKAKGPSPAVALQKAHEKCFQNLHSIERHEEHTIAHAVQTSYKKTKVYLWPASTTTGMKAGRTVQTILHLAGFKNVKSKVIGSRNPHNTVKAVFKGLNAVETPKDVQEKFGRTVVESYLL